MQTIEYYGHSVTFPDMPERDQFLSKLKEGRWEADLFEFMDQHIDADTVAIDVGAWIGVTPFWAAQKARKVIAVDPDPYCCRVLREMRAMNSLPVTVIEGALAADIKLRVGAFQAFGDSQTSALYASRQESIEVEGIHLSRLVDAAEGSPIFLKIDIEGYEFSIIDQLAELDPNQVRAISLSIHPTHYARALPGASKWKAAKDTFALVRALRQNFRLQTPYALFKALSRLFRDRASRNDDLQFVARHAIAK